MENSSSELVDEVKQYLKVRDHLHSGGISSKNLLVSQQIIVYHVVILHPLEPLSLFLL